MYTAGQHKTGGLCVRISRNEISFLCDLDLRSWAARDSLGCNRRRAV